MRYLAGLLALVAFPALAQTCPPAPSNPIPRDAVKFSVVPASMWVEGGNAVGPFTYTLYELVGTAWTVRCTTTATSFGQTSLAVGTHTWAVTAKTPASFPPNVESARSAQAGWTVQPPPLTPGAPITFTVEGAIVITGTITLTPNP